MIYPEKTLAVIPPDSEAINNGNSDYHFVPSDKILVFHTPDEDKTYLNTYAVIEHQDEKRLTLLTLKVDTTFDEPFYKTIRREDLTKSQLQNSLYNTVKMQMEAVQNTQSLLHNFYKHPEPTTAKLTVDLLVMPDGSVEVYNEDSLY